jgi:SNF2 family DNA or RNA helicase
MVTHLLSASSGVIFSQFARFLDLVESALRGAGVQFTRLDGSMQPAKRTENLNKFKTDPSVS